MATTSQIKPIAVSTRAPASDTLLEPRHAADVEVELFHVELDGCVPCAFAIAEVDEAAGLVRDELAARGRGLLVRTLALHEPGHALALGIDNPVTVRVAGVDVSPADSDGHLAACGVSGAAPKSCRAYSWNGQVYGAPPAGLIVEAIHRHLDAETDPGLVEASDQGAVDVLNPSDERSFAMTTMTAEVTSPAPTRPGVSFAELQAALTGRVSTPEEPAYAEAVSPWNLAIPVQPRGVVEADSARDVAETIRFARRHGLTVTPQATGHGPIRALIGDILLATHRLDECVVHPEGWARVGAGVKWLRVVQAAAPHGLAPLSGSITDVGVVGYTTGGGLGPMARTYGLASDRVRAFEVVTGDGQLRRATPTEHPELFFGLRGGKGALGIVTAVEFDLVHQPDFYGGALWFDGTDASTVLERWRTWSATLPESATTSVALFQLPPLDGVPEPLAGRLTVSVRYVWTGPSQEGERHFADMRAAAPVLLDDVRVKPYTEIDSVHTDPLDPMPVREHSLLLGDFSADAVQALVRAAGPGSDSQQFLVEVRQLGGAFARGGEHPSAFHPRHTSYSVLAVGLPGPDTERDHAAVQSALDPWALPARLPNFSFSPEELAAAYDSATRARLVAALDHYDPDEVLAVGQALRGPA